MKNLTDLRRRWDNGEWGLYNIGIYMSEVERNFYFEQEAEKYCSQNNQNCYSCSLVSYGQDCHNNEIRN